MVWFQQRPIERLYKKLIDLSAAIVVISLIQVVARLSNMNTFYNG